MSTLFLLKRPPCAEETTCLKAAEFLSLSHLFPMSSLFLLKSPSPAEETTSVKEHHPSLAWTI
jgi:hypothetical protein